MCVDSILSFPSVFLSSLLYLWCVWCDKQSSNHPISIPLLHCCFIHFTPFNTSFLHLLISPLITLLCGCVWLGVFYTFPPPLPFLVKERMRLEREEATRLLEEETEVRHSSSAGPETTFLSVLNSSLTTNTTELQLQDFAMLLYP